MIDFHIHSNCSDGSDDLNSLIENLKKNGVSTFALTDHDTAEGCRQILSTKELKNKIKNYNINFICGAEWSCIYGEQKMHILAYGFNPFDEKIIALEKEMRDMLDKKDEYRSKYLIESGFVFSERSKKYLETKENVRSMDFALCLVNDGYFSEIEEAFKKCLTKIKYPFVCRFDAVKAIKTLKECGATIVWAHSIYDLKRKVTSFEDVERIANELKPYGLDGLECYYSLYSKDEILKLVDIAKRNSLLITCGSDYHGENKEVCLGCFSSDDSSVDENELMDFKNLLAEES